MRSSTRSIHDEIAKLGEALGFEVTREVSDSALRLRLDDAYRPRIDLMWSLPLGKAERDALAWTLGVDTEGITHLPVVGIEVEGTTPSTKTMGSDVANLAALGAPLGLLVVSEEGEQNIYRRAARAIRTIRRSFGDIRVLPVEADWLDALSKKKWPVGTASITSPKARGPAGGESLEWSARTRRKLTEVGEAAGFVVAAPYTPGILNATFDWQRGRSTQLNHTTDPRAGLRKQIAKTGEYLTECQIDLAWLMPLPLALSAFLQELDHLDPCNREHGTGFSELWTHVPIAAFELESSSGKHAGGGLLNLAAYGVFGVALTPDDGTAAELSATLRTYRPTLGLRNVFVRSEP